MSPIRSRCLAAALLIIGGGGAGVLAFSQRPEQPGRPGQPDAQSGSPAHSSPAARRLLEARIETAREILRQDLKRQQVMVDPQPPLLEEICLWSRRLLDDRIRLASTPGERLEAIREHRNRMTIVDQLAAQYTRTGQGRVADGLRARYFRLEADQFLAEAGVDPEKEPPAAPEKEGPRPAPSAPSPPPARPAPPR